MQGSANEILSIFLVATAVILLLIALVAAFVIVYQRRVMAQKARIQEIEAQAQRMRTAAMLEAQEQERMRIAKDLHDEVGADLSAIKMRLNLLSRQLHQADALAEGLQQSRDMIDASIESVRRISHNLLPPALESLGLPDALQSFARQTTQATGVAFVVQTAGERRRLPIHHELSLFRILHELCQNSLRHGAAQQLQLVLVFGLSALDLSYTDDGRGFDTSQDTASGKGLGLSNIQSRIEAIGAEFKMESAPGQGIHVHIHLPYPSTAFLPL
jgi:signal transduction histidine kinase